MMGFFPQTIAARKADREIGAVLFAFFDFLGAPMRLWPGFDTITTGGHDWIGMGDFGSVDGLSLGSGDASSTVTFKLSGLSPQIQALAIDSEALVKNRSCAVYLHAFSLRDEVDAEGRRWQLGEPLDAPLSIWSGIMDVMTFSASGPSTRSVSLTACDLLADRRRPQFGLATDADQQARWPGDTALAFRSTLRFKALRQPW